MQHSLLVWLCVMWSVLCLWHFRLLLLTLDNPANHIAGNHNQETFLVQISVSINININIYNNNDCSSLGSLILEENVAGSCVLNFDAADLPHS